MNGKFGNFQQKQFDDDLQPTFDPFNVEDLLNLPLDDDLIINQDFELNFDDHLDHTAVIHSNSCFDSSTFLNHLDNNNNNSYSLNSLFPPPGGSHLLDDPFHAPLPGLGKEERPQLIPLEESATFDSTKHLQWISDCMGEDYWSSENLNKLFGTTMSAPMKARPDECSETQYYPFKPAREGSECSETHYPLKPAQEGSECSETQYYPLKPVRDESECSETQYDPLKPVRDEFECSETQYDPLKPVRHESISTTKRAARSKRPRASSDSWSSRPVPLSQGDSERIQVTSPTKPVGSKKKGSGMGKGRPTIDSTQGGETRKCQHCETDKTPQWRTGPNGAKTLCNACGVRYKSGRLAAEYRPAASPTFVPSKHSNSHRKVLEIQRQNKAMSLQQQQQQQQQQFQHDHFNYHILNNSMIFQLSINDDPSINGDPSINDDYFINQHFGEDFRDPN